MEITDVRVKQRVSWDKGKKFGEVVTVTPKYDVRTHKATGVLYEQLSGVEVWVDPDEGDALVKVPAKELSYIES